MKKIIILLLLVVLTGCSTDELTETIINITVIEETTNTLEELSHDNYGSLAALEQDVFTIEEMLVYALQDEYTARAEYEYIMSIYGDQNPFSNIILSEERHIEMLLPLFTTYNITLIEDTSSDHLFEFSSLQETYDIGVIAEINNIAMYNKFLETEHLPNDLIDVFTKLRDASINHLAAFEKKAT